MDWNEIAHSYSQVENPRKEIFFPFVRDKLNEPRPAKLLDFGCGDGTFAMMPRSGARDFQLRHCAGNELTGAVLRGSPPHRSGVSRKRNISIQSFISRPQTCYAVLL
jgi:hypothetical protein